VVRRFANHMSGIDPATEVPATHLLVQQKGRATPYLYSASDIAALISAAGMLRTPHRVATFRTLIGLLAVTGMRVGEAIGLDRDDFDTINWLLTIRNAKFGKSRELPLHPSTVTAMLDYLRRPDRPTSSSSTPAFLVTTIGTRFHYMGVQPVFRQIVDGAGLKPRSAACRPRLHDLRHGFAVDTILDGYRDGAEPGNRIALLSTYLGHVDPASTYWYLSAAPELLTLAGGRLERHLGGAA
jgi:integrase